MSALTRAYPTGATQSIPNAAWTAITFGATRQDTLGMWAAGSPSRLTVPVGGGGVYAVSGSLQWGITAAGVRGIGIQVNAATFWATDMNAGGSATYNIDLAIATLIPLVPGDYIELMGYQSSGAALNHVTSAGYGGELAAALLT